MRLPFFGGNADSRLWTQAEVTLRPLEDWERPVCGTVQDDRMIVLARRPGSDLAVARILDLYQPLERPSLLPDFMRLFGGPRRPRAARVVAFYRRYGALCQHVPGPVSEVPAWTVRLSAAAQARLIPDASELQEPIWWVAEQAKELRLSYDVYRALQTDNLEGLRGMLGGIPEGLRLDRFAIEAGRLVPYLAEEESRPATPPRRRAGSAAMEQPVFEFPPNTPLRPLTDYECRWEGSRLLTSRLDAAQQQCHFRWSVARREGQDRFRPVGSLSFPDLVTAMWLQFGDLVARDELYGTCHGCGEPFHATGKQRFCDKQCGDAWRQRHLYRKRDQ